ncbi:hypothetical protein NQ317_007509 [Molorchus minor]|uniref:Sodium-independent sulfate anion transporter n=1 Tax=Molorchus minor TaxID=1323400 RepID=A0ABQ9J5B0_9CUCU|nr:hypothetical protein NQ317_007509 [Molorchus minor]
MTGHAFRRSATLLADCGIDYLEAVWRIKNRAHQETERDLQGEGGGGGTRLAYDNPALTVSSTSISYRHRNSSYGSNDFIGRLDESFRFSDRQHQKEIAGRNDKIGGTMGEKKARSACSKKMIHRRLPILSWLPKYDSTCAVGDLVAGITVGLTVIPQALAYANIAGVPTEYGLYSSFLGCFVYIFLGSSKDVPVGPSAISSLMTYQVIKGHGPEYAVLLCFLTGVVQLLMGIFGLGFLIDFVSGPVSSGFTSAVALIIVTSQVKDVLGIKASGTTFVDTWRSIFSDIHNTQGWDTLLGITCIAVLLILRIVSTLKVGPTGGDKEPTKCQKIATNTLWLIGTARNAILVIVCGFVGYSFCLNGPPPFKVIGQVPPGLPAVKVPPFGYEEERNSTTITHTFLDMVTDMGSGIIVVPLITLLENIAVCKAFANGKMVDATQELLAIGACNVANSFVQAFRGRDRCPGAPSTIAAASGPSRGLYTSLLVIAALLFFTPYFYYIPKATLAGIIIAAVVFMVEVKVVKPMWRSEKRKHPQGGALTFCSSIIMAEFGIIVNTQNDDLRSNALFIAEIDLVLGFVTFIACLVLALEIGILIGVGINLLFILYQSARPKITVEKLRSNGGTEYLMLTPDRCLIFPSVDYVRNLVTKHSIRQGIPVVIDCSHIYGADYTAATVIESLSQDFAARDQPLFFFNLKPSVSSVFEGLGPKDFVVYYNEYEIDNLLKNRSYIKKQNEINQSMKV